MLWVIKCKSKANVSEIRTAALPEHRTYLDSKASEIFFAGGLQNDDATEATGALFILNVPGRQQAQSFVDDEPMNKAGVFEKVTISRLVKGRLHPQLADS